MFQTVEVKGKFKPQKYNVKLRVSTINRAISEFEWTFKRIKSIPARGNDEK